MTAAASAAPVQRNANTTPNACSSRMPAGAPPAEGAKQQVAGDDRRQHERKVDERVQRASAPETPPRERPCHGNRHGHADERGRQGHLQAEQDDREIARVRVHRSWSGPVAARTRRCGITEILPDDASWHSPVEYQQESTCFAPQSWPVSWRTTDFCLRTNGFVARQAADARRLAPGCHMFVAGRHICGLIHDRSHADNQSVSVKLFASEWCLYEHALASRTRRPGSSVRMSRWRLRNVRRRRRGDHRRARRVVYPARALSSRDRA